MKTIGILGGMGPVATAELYARIISYCQKHYGAVQDADYPPIFIYSLPLHGTDETGITDHKVVLQTFINEAEKLETFPADFIIIPCNTLDELRNQLHRATRLPVMDIIDGAVKSVRMSGAKRVVLLASETTYKHRLYQSHLPNLLIPDVKAQKQISKVILNVMGGKKKQSDRDILLKIIEGFNPDAAILGCTELSVLLHQKDSKVKLFDALDILAETAASRAETG